MANDSNHTSVTILSPKKVSALLGISLATLYRWIANGTFPPPLQLGPGKGRVGWPQQVVEAWIAERPTVLPLKAA